MIETEKMTGIESGLGLETKKINIRSMKSTKEMTTLTSLIGKEIDDAD